MISYRVWHDEYHDVYVVTVEGLEILISPLEARTAAQAVRIGLKRFATAKHKLYRRARGIMTQLRLPF